MLGKLSATHNIAINLDRIEGLSKMLSILRKARLKDKELRILML